jgi:YARHG domain
MNRVKQTKWAMTVLSVMCVVACGKKPADKPAESVVPVQAEVVEKASAGKVVNEALFGLYAGEFNPSDAYVKAKKAYDKWTREQSGEMDFFGSTDLKDTPEQFRKYMYKHPLYGYYEFTSPNRLSVVLTDMRDDGTFKAKSVAAGNEREVVGTWEKTDRGWHFVGKEPGDKPIDGTFDMTLSEKENLLRGTWTVNGDKAVPKSFALKKTEPKYDTKLGQNPDKEQYIDLGRSGFEKNPSVDVLKTADVENLTQPQIRIIRNLIFARHGYSFGAEDLRRVFEGYDWYVPRTNDVKADLTELEKNNLVLLKRYEQYAEKHYDEFGR